MNAAHVTLAIILVMLAVPMAVLLTPLAVGAFVVAAALWRLNVALQPWTPAPTGAA